MVEFLEWDSNFFNLKIGKSIISREEEFEPINDFDLLYIFSSQKLTKLYDRKDIILVDEKMEFSKKINKLELVNNEIVEIKEFDYYSMNPFQKQALLNLVFLSGHKSRFKIDHNFQQGSFEKLYIEWIEKSMNSEFHRVFAIKNEDIIIAFITLELPEKVIYAKIGLVAVNPAYQGLGLSKQLINYAENMANNFNRQIFHVVTQGSNYHALKAYENRGFTLNNKTYIYHYWNKP
jgi:dTDP-4-amino-4,6-dideoxy-D-galactose acyltransferase